MISLLRQFWRLLSPGQRRRLLVLQILIAFMSLAEIASVAAVGYFMSVVADMRVLEGDGLLARWYAWSGLATPEAFLGVIGLLVFVVLLCSSLLGVLTTWRMMLYGHQVGAEMANRLYRHFLGQPWLFHSAGSSSELLKRVAQETARVTNGILQPLMLMNAKGILALFMVIAVIMFNPLVALLGVGFLIGAYLLLYRIVKARLLNCGHLVSRASTQRFKLMNEGFGGIRDVLLSGRQGYFVRRFNVASADMAYGQGATHGIAQCPRYAMELVALGSVMLLVLYLLFTQEEGLSQMLPILAVYALAGFKLLPAFQQVYNSAAAMRGHQAALECLLEDLRASAVDVVDQQTFAPPTTERLPFRAEIVLEDLSFRYPGVERAALRGVSLRIPRHQRIGLVGASGSGKSTLIDIILGLITPTQGCLMVDGQKIQAEQLQAWRNIIGFVPQHIFLSDDSVRANIAFGYDPCDIDEERVLRAVRLAQMDEFLAELPQGLDTRVGERGVQLSGGQRQRIGIARALYHDSEILILDEATSALDGITEKSIMTALDELAQERTMIMIAHRLATVRNCDIIYLFADGEIVDSGTYEELVQRNQTFREMARHA